MLIKFPATNTRIRPTARLRATGIAIGPAVTFGPIGITAPKSATSIVAPETRRSDTRRPRAVFLRAGIVALALGIVALALMGANWARAGSSYGESNEAVRPMPRTLRPDPPLHLPALGRPASLLLSSLRGDLRSRPAP